MMTTPNGGPLQEISINRVKSHRKILQKCENQIAPTAPGKSPNKFTNSIKSLIEANCDTEAVEKENICSSKLSSSQLVLENTEANILSVKEKNSFSVRKNGIKVENAPAVEFPFRGTLDSEKKLPLKENSVVKKLLPEFSIAKTFPEAEEKSQLKGNITRQIPQQGKKENDAREAATVGAEPQNRLPQAISVDDLKAVVIKENVIVSPSQRAQPIEILSTALPRINGTVLKQTHDETHQSLPAPDSSADGPDVRTIESSNNSNIKLASTEPDSSLADNYLGPIKDSDSSASETSFSSSPGSSASVTNLNLIPISTSKGYSKPLDEQTLGDNKPVSSGITVTSSVFQSVSSQASYCKSSQRAPLSRRNARERNRVRLVSQGFAILRQHVPQAARRKKLSKVETLRCAVDYIKALSRMIEENNVSNGVVPSPSNSSALSNSFETPSETNQTSSFQLDSGQVKHERDEHRHPLHEELQRQHLQTMLPIDSSRLLNASMLSKQHEQCLQIAPSRQHKDGTDFSSAPAISSGNAMLGHRVFNLPLNEPNVVGCQFIEFPCSPDLTYVPVALCASTPAVPTIPTLSQAAQPVTSTAPILNYAMPTTSSIIPKAGDAFNPTPSKVTTLIHTTSSLTSIASILTNTTPAISSVSNLSSNVISTSHPTSCTVPCTPTLSLTATTMSSSFDLGSPVISCTSTPSDGGLSVDSYSSSVPEVSSLMDPQEDLFNDDETDDTQLMDCLSWWQEAP